MRLASDCNKIPNQLCDDQTDARGEKSSLGANSFDSARRVLIFPYYLINNVASMKRRFSVCLFLTCIRFSRRSERALCLKCRSVLLLREEFQVMFSLN